MAVVEVAGTSYHIDEKLKEKWDRIKDGKLTKEDDDKVFIVDGRERSGKSVFTIQQACYIDPTLPGDLSRICFTADEFLRAIRKTDSTKEVTKCIIFDEAFRGLASRSAMSKINKKIIQALMEVGQKNLVIWIVLPSFFLLDLYPAMIRSNALFHIKKDKGSNKRSFSVYSHKKKGSLYQIGIRKGWTYAVPTRFKGRFTKAFPGGEVFEKAYRKKKWDMLVESEKEIEKPEIESKHLQQRDLIIYNFVKQRNLSMRKAEVALREIGIDISYGQVAEIMRKVAERLQKVVVTVENPSENVENVLNVGL